ncbi:MAG: histidine--tRNA ligase [Hyphomicrobiales bacterium]|nr:histidine--tRNA ligase [Hyphomicrobiales bacterium]MDE2115819.1 histidine--tRNA ligase [Hyphomicrobiales bacterium]
MTQEIPQTTLVKPMLPRGFADRNAADVAGTNKMLAEIGRVYALYGFAALETPFIETTQALGKFLPDTDRPNAGVFSFQDDDEQWLSLRYDLTAPLARHVAENFDAIPKPYRTWRAGYVFRNEKPGPGRFRQFMQCDADTIGSASLAADAEICMMAADTLEALGIKRGDYVIKVNNRKVLDGVLEAADLGGDDKAATRLIVLRAIDKLDRLGLPGVRQLLGAGRKDDSGDFTKGAGLAPDQIEKVVDFLGGSTSALVGNDGLAELAEIAGLLQAAGYGEDRVRIDTSVVRGLEYYTGPVFEAELTFEVKGEDGKPVRFGSVGGGGRYDGLVGRFRAESLPATGFSIGVSRLYAALRAIGSPLVNAAKMAGPVVVLVMDRDQIASYQALVATLRQAGIAAEMYLGAAGMNAQLKYADKRGSQCAVIQGSNERSAGEVVIKDLILGASLSGATKDRADYLELKQKAQFAVKTPAMVEAVQQVLARHK